MMRITKYLFTGLVSFIVLGFLGAVVVTYIYDERIESFLIGELNKRLRAKVEVDGPIDFTLFSHFPKASLNFHDIKIEGSHGSRPLGNFEELTLLLDLEALLGGDYQISELLLKRGSINILTNKQGQGNYMVWQDTSQIDTAGRQRSDFQLTLDNVQLKHVDLLYQDQSNNFSIDTDIQKGELNGQFNRDQFALTSDILFLNDSMKINDITYFPQKEVEMSLALNVRKTDKKNAFTIKNGKLIIDGSPFKVSGTVNAHEEFTELDLKTRGEKLSVQDIPRLLPASYAKYIRDYEGKGKLAINSYIKGRVDERSLPNIRIQYNLRETQLTTKELKQPIEQLELKGQFSIYGKSKDPTTLLKITRCSASYLGESFDLSMTIHDFSKPRINLTANGKLNIAVLHPLFDKSNLSHLSGIIEVQNLQFDGPLQNVEKAVQQDKIKGSGSLSFDAVKARYKNQELRLPKGDLAFDGGDIDIENLALAIGQSRFSIGGRASNIITYWKQIANNHRSSQPLHFEGVVRSSYFNVDDVFQLFPAAQQTTSATDEQQLHLQRLFNIKGAFSFLVDDLRYKKFNGREFFGDIVLKPGRITFQKFSMQTMGGQVDVNAHLKFPNSSDIMGEANVSVKEVAIDSLFYQNNNFGQNTLTHEHLKGSLTSEGQMTMEWRNGQFRMDKLTTNASVQIKNGELIQFEPMSALANHIKLQELEHIRFATLENTIRIENQMIHIPEMVINSNAANLKVKGTHSFNNVVDYQCRVNLSKILANKFRIVKAPANGYSRNGEGQLNLFLTMKGPLNDPEIKYDKQSVQEKIADDLKEEKKELERALRNQPSEQYTPQKEKEQWEVDEEVEYIEWGDQDE